MLNFRKFSYRFLSTYKHYPIATKNTGSESINKSILVL